MKMLSGTGKGVRIVGPEVKISPANISPIIIASTRRKHTTTYFLHRKGMFRNI